MKWILMLTLFFAGCASVDVHTRSCGPRALVKIIGHDVITQKQISEDILSRPSLGNFGRNFLIIFKKELQEVTWPEEIKYILNKYGYKVKKIHGDLDSVAIGMVSMRTKGIVLLKHKNKISYHWIALPYDEDALSDYFGEGTTIIDRIYKVELK